MSCRSNQLLACIRYWKLYQSEAYYIHDPFLKRNIVTVAIAFYGIVIVDNILTCNNVYLNSIESNMTILETYHEKHMIPKYSDVIPYHPIVPILVFAYDKLVMYAWIFSDVLIIAFARAAYQQFRLHVSKSKKYILINRTKNVWIRIVQEFEKVLELLRVFNEFLKPLIWATVTLNTYYIAISLNRFLVPAWAFSLSEASEKTDKRPTVLQEANSICFFIQLIVTTFTVVVYCARVHEYIHEMEEVLESCPVSNFTTEVWYLRSMGLI